MNIQEYWKDVDLVSQHWWTFNKLLANLAVWLGHRYRILKLSVYLAGRSVLEVVGVTSGITSSRLQLGAERRYFLQELLSSTLYQTGQ